MLETYWWKFAARQAKAKCDSNTSAGPTCGYTLDAGLYQLTVEMAWHFTRYVKEQTPEQRGQYQFAEVEARAKRVGLWSDPSPVPPWEWRKR